MNVPRAAFVVALSSVFLATVLFAVDYQGARAILKQLDAGITGDHASAQKSDPIREFRADVKRFQEHTSTLAPDDAARDWLALFDRANKLPSSASYRNYGSLPRPLLEVFQALPPPAAWDALAARIAARPSPEKGSPDFTTPVLRLVAAVLQHRSDAGRQAVEEINQQVENLEGSNQEIYAAFIEKFRAAFFKFIGDEPSLLADFEAKVKSLQPGSAGSPTDRQSPTRRMYNFEVPNLVQIAGPARAEALLRDVFSLDLQGMSIADPKTAALARKVALEMGDSLKFAPWSILDSADSDALYELLDRRFPATLENSNERQVADPFHLLNLIVHGSYDKATALALKLGGETDTYREDVLRNLGETALVEVASQGHAREVAQFLRRLLADHPALPYWQSYTEAAVLAGEADDMISQAKAACERTNLKPQTRSRLRSVYGNALLAADRVSEALPILRESAAAGVRAAATSESNSSEAQEGLSAVTALAGVARVLGDNTLLNEQLDTIAELAKVHPAIIANASLPGDSDLNEAFLAAGRGPELERLLGASLLGIEREAARNRAQYPGMPFGGDETQVYRAGQTPLFALVDLYFRAGRYDDVVALLDESKGWGLEDMARMLSADNIYGRTDRFFPQAARSLWKTGHAEAALRLINIYLERNGGSDPGYALLLELLSPDKAEARLNELFQGDQFEERPLIWRAVLQLGQNRLDAAEKSARQAISIDPSDGEEGTGDRMRAYAVLGDILERKGDAPKAAGMRQAVQAIRLSEEADRVHTAGLLSRAVGMYEKALGYFSDAYCIQSRLAIQLVALGKVDEAMSHYERAYELMPESFGRMESHCFGCERAFAGKRAQNAAERVFTKLAAQQPDNPRVHYLLGYLRGEESRRPEAAAEFREAVWLDADYINAWKQLAQNSDDPADRDKAALNLLRLDPRHKHDSADLSAVSDLRALWPAVEAAEKFALPKPEDFYPLAASKAFLEQERAQRPKPSPGADDPANSPDDYRPMDFYNRANTRLTPQQAIINNTVISQALIFLSRNGAPDSSL